MTASDVQTPVYIYIRFSTPKQEKGSSEARQKELCEEYAERRGWTVVEHLKDLGKSAWKGDHLNGGNLGKFAERVRAGDIPAGSILLVENLDRLSRQGHEIAQDWMRDMFRHGLRIAAVASGDTIFEKGGSLIGTFEVLFKAHLAETESTNKSVRVQKAFAKNLKAAHSGRKITKKAPGWLVLRPDRSGFDIIEDRADTIRLIYQMSADGFGAPAIARKLNELGRKPFGGWRKSSETWEFSSVAMLLRHPGVEGDYVRGWLTPAKVGNGERIVGYYDHRIVDADLVARARAGVASRDKTGGARRTERVNLFSGLVYCNACGSRMNMRTTKKAAQYRYFQCSNAHMGRGCGHKALFPYEAFETAALNEILHLVLEDHHFQRPDDSYKAAVDVAEAKKAVADLSERKRRLLRTASMLEEDDPDLGAELAELTGKQAVATATLEAAEKALEIARGAVSPAEHLSRVLGLKNALYAEDVETRSVARMKVADAMAGMGVKVMCGSGEDGQRVVLNFGLGNTDVVTIHMDGQGNITERFNLVESTRVGVTGDWMGLASDSGYGETRTRQNLARKLGGGEATAKSRLQADQLVKRQREAL